ncbi:MAG: hypothetical protein MJY98_08590 [Fibrobacter sp.]|nr:hypothetical protein [Fibrobacter sp.]
MKPKNLVEMLPYGYVRERNFNGSVSLTLNTEGTSAFTFLKKVPLKCRMPPLSQNEVDAIQCEMGMERIIIDWYDDGNCRYIIIMNKESDDIYYRIILNAFFGDETFDLHGSFYEKGNKGIREKIYKERYLKLLPEDALSTNADFADERYDIIFPDHPLSHCRRLANVITLNADCHMQPVNGQISDSYDNDIEPPST